MARVKKKPGANFDDNEVQRRAFAAWFRGGGRDRPADNSGVEQSHGKYYVALRNVNGIMAVYRIRNDGVLKRLKRWPQEVE
jgi:hypothetical protein